MFLGKKLFRLHWIIYMQHKPMLKAEEARYAENYFYFLADLIEATHDDIDTNKYIYAGIEIGQPTIEDIYEVAKDDKV